MKSILIFIMSLILCVSVRSEEFSSGGIFIHSTMSNQNYNLIDVGSIKTNKLESGETYRLNTGVMEISTGTNIVSLGMSDGVEVTIHPSSTFSIDAFNQSILNADAKPSILKASYSISSLSLMNGEIDVICPKMDDNSQVILQTPLVNIILSNGKLNIKSTQKYVMINVIKGSVKVMDSRNKVSVIDNGKLGLIIPYPGRDGEIMVTDRVIVNDDLTKMSKELNKLDVLKTNVLFVVLDHKIVGIDLK